MMRKSIMVGICVVMVIGIIYVARGSLAVFTMKRVLHSAIGADLTQQLPDGLHLVLAGTGSPIPDPQRAGPCTAVIAGKSVFVIDVGSGGARNLMRSKIPMGAIHAVFLTHFHSDHIDGLGELGVLRWVSAGHAQPLAVFGPEGTQEIVSGFNQAYRADAQYRTAHHGGQVAPPSGAGLTAHPFIFSDASTSTKVWDMEGVQITAFLVDHRPAEPCVGYKIAYAGRVAVISGDTRKSITVETMAKGADLLLHDGLSRELVGYIENAAKAAGLEAMRRIFHDIPDYHATPIEAAETAAAAGVGALVFTHVVPGLPIPGLSAIYLQQTDAIFHGIIRIGSDGLIVSLPASGKGIHFGDAN